MFEQLLAKHLSCSLNLNNLLPNTQFGFRKNLVSCDALLTLVHHVQASLDAGSKTRLLSLDFSSALDVVNHKAVL